MNIQRSLSLVAIIVSITEIGLLHYFYIKMKQKEKLSPYIVFLYFIIFISEQLMTVMGINIMIKLIMILLFVGIGCVCFCGISISRSIILTAIYGLLLMVSELVVSTILIAIEPSIRAQIIELTDELTIQIAILTKSVNFISIVIFCRILSGEEKIYNIRALLLMLVPIIANMYMLFYIFRKTYISVGECKEINREVIVVSFLIGVSSVTLVLFFEKFAQDKAIETRMRLMEQQITMQKKYYSNRAVAETKLRQMYHDIKNHIIAATGISSDEKRIEYITEIANEITQYEVYTETGNDMLNALLSEKNRIMKEESIQCTSIVSVNDISDVKEIDLITIFGNAVDNAIEACQKVEQTKRYITINTATIGQFFIIKIKNSMTGNVKVENHRIKTSKKNKVFHGIGLENIRRAVEKYSGNINIETGNNCFILTILIPVRAK